MTSRAISNNYNHFGMDGNDIDKGCVILSFFLGPVIGIGEATVISGLWLHAKCSKKPKIEKWLNKNYLEQFAEEQVIEVIKKQLEEKNFNFFPIQNEHQLVQDAKNIKMIIAIMLKHKIQTLDELQQRKELQNIDVARYFPFISLELFERYKQIKVEKKNILYEKIDQLIDEFVSFNLKKNELLKEKVEIEKKILTFHQQFYGVKTVFETVFINLKVSLNEFQDGLKKTTEDNKEIPLVLLENEWAVGLNSVIQETNQLLGECGEIKRRIYKNSEEIIAKEIGEIEKIQNGFDQIKEKIATSEKIFLEDSTQPLKLRKELIAREVMRLDIIIARINKLIIFKLHMSTINKRLLHGIVTLLWVPTFVWGPIELYQNAKTRKQRKAKLAVLTDT